MIRETFNTNVSTVTISRFLVGFKYTFKRLHPVVNRLISAENLTRNLNYATQLSQLLVHCDRSSFVAKTRFWVNTLVLTLRVHFISYLPILLRYAGGRFTEEVVLEGELLVQQQPCAQKIFIALIPSVVELIQYVRNENSESDFIIMINASIRKPELLHQ